MHAYTNAYEHMHNIKMPSPKWFKNQQEFDFERCTSSRKCVALENNANREASVAVNAIA